MIKTYKQYDPEVMIQEGLDTNEEFVKWVEDTRKKLTAMEHIDGSMRSTPHISHMIYFSNSENPKNIKLIAIKKIIETTNKFNEIDKNYKHYFWTNHPNIIPEEIKTIQNLEIRLIEEFNEHILWRSLQKVLDTAQLESGYFAQASDILRLMTVQKYGGIYHDLDYSVYNAEKLIEITDRFDFVNAREVDIDNSYIGNAFIAASANNPIINTAVKFCNENLNPDEYKNALDYKKWPLNNADKIFFETGPVMLTIAYYKSIDISRSSGKTDVILPPKMLYNYDYARATTSEYVADDSCYYPSSKTSEEKLQLVHNFHGIEIETLGGDMFSGSWAANLLKPINYDQPNFYLELGNQSTEYYFGEI